METTTAALRRGLCTAFAGGAMVAALSLPALMAGPSATAAPDPCAASEVARTVGKVAANTGSYLDSHPETNQALTTISQQPAGPQSLAALKSYFDANPEVAKDMQQLQQPLISLSSRCKLPITVPQLLGLVQQAQSQGGALPGAAQAVGLPDVAVPAQSSPASAVTPGAGPLPGPATTSAE
jgi:heme-binding protein